MSPEHGQERTVEDLRALARGLIKSVVTQLQYDGVLDVMITGRELLYDKDDSGRLLGRVEYRPNRVIALDGSIPHQARPPGDDRFRMSIIVRGTYEWRRSAS